MQTWRRQRSDAVATFANDVARKHGYTFAPHMPVSHWLEHIAASASEDYKPKKDKYVVKLPKEVKKAA